jgi:hypothetical protein
MGQVSFSDLVDGVIHTAAHHNDRFNALKNRINAIQSDNLEDSSVTGPKIAMGSDAQGDVLIRGVTSYKRRAAGVSGQFFKTLGAGADPEWGGPFHELAEMLKFTGTNFTTTSTSFVDVTGLSITRVIKSTKVLMILNCVSFLSVNAGYSVDFLAGGVSVTGGLGFRHNQNNDAGVEQNRMFVALATSLTPGSVIFKVQTKATSSGTVTFEFTSASGNGAYFTLIEI